MRFTPIILPLLPLTLAAPSLIAKRCDAPIAGACGGGGGGSSVSGSFGLGGIISSALSIAGSVSSQFSAIASVWVSGDIGFCGQVSATLAADANIQLGADVIAGAIKGCDSGYVRVGAGVDLAAAAAIFKCDQKDVGYVKHSGAVNVGGHAYGHGGGGGHEEKWYKHPKADVCHQCTPCGKDD